MNFIEIHIKCNNKIAELISEQLTEFAALSVTFKDAADQPVYEPLPGTTPTLWTQTILTGLFNENHPMQSIIEHLEKYQAEGTIHNFHIEPLASQDWVKLSLEHFKPLDIGKTLCICPSWIAPPASTRIQVRLDPGLAFGTGAHPTTQLCLEWLESHASALPKQVIDYGCGSGILGISALKLGAKNVVAIDYDPQALTATQSNASLNGITPDQLHICLPKDLQPLKADLLIANILANPLIELAPEFYNLLKNNGKIIISGILEQQIEKIVEIYASWFNIDASFLNDGWVLFEGTKSKLR